jgi:hypothetical protein
MNTKDEALSTERALKLALEALEKLWNIIDDIDTYGDMAKADEKLYRSLVERRQRTRFKETGISTDGYTLDGGAITAIREALASGANHAPTEREQPAQPEQEPEKEVTITCSCGDKFYIPLDELIKQLQEDKSQDFPRRFDTHAIPPQRTWVGLTEDEQDELVYEVYDKRTRMELAIGIEAKLKDKNGY